MASIDSTQPAPTLLPSQGGNPADFVPRTAQHLYTPDRIAAYDTRTLGTLFAMAHHDTLCATSVYLGMSRSETVNTAWTSCADIAFALRDRHDDGDVMASALLHDLAAKICAIPR
jgi:hypothetical protein